MLAFHAIFGAYGFWLPNDPRGSWSSWIGSWELLRYGGAARKVQTRRSAAGVEHDQAMRMGAKNLLNHPPVRFKEDQIAAIAGDFAVACRTYGYRAIA